MYTSTSTFTNTPCITFRHQEGKHVFSRATKKSVFSQSSKTCTRASLFSVYPFDCTFSRILDCSETKREVIVSLTPLNRASNPPSSAEQRCYSQHNTPDCRGCQEACSKPVITEQDKEQPARSIVKHISPTETEYVCLSRCGRCQIVWSLKCWYQRQGMKRLVKITIKNSDKCKEINWEIPKSDL